MDNNLGNEENTYDVKSYLGDFSKKVGVVMYKIDILDTTGLSPSIFRMVNSSVFGIMEYQNLRIDTMIDLICRRGFNILHELFSHSDRVVLFLPIEKGIITLNDIEAIIAEWRKYFFILYREKSIKHGLTLHMRYINGYFLFILSKQGDAADKY